LPGTKLSANPNESCVIVRARLRDRSEMAPDRSLGILYVADDHGLAREVSHLQRVHPRALARQAAAV